MVVRGFKFFFQGAFSLDRIKVPSTIIGKNLPWTQGTKTADRLARYLLQIDRQASYSFYDILSRPFILILVFSAKIIILTILFPQPLIFLIHI